MNFSPHSSRPAAPPTQEWDVLEDAPPPPDVTWPAQVEFPIVMRGYDRRAVDEYLDEIARLIEELEASRSPEAAVKAALDQVGEETSSILKRARETEWEITSKSRAKADDRLQTAEREARQMRAAAEAEVRRLDADTEKLWEERERLLGDIGRLSGQLTRVVDAANRRFPPADAGVAGTDSAGAVAVVGGEEPTDAQPEPPPEAVAPASVEPIDDREIEAVEREQIEAVEHEESLRDDGAEPPERDQIDEEPTAFADDPPGWAEDEPLHVEEGQMEDELSWAEQELVGHEPPRVERHEDPEEERMSADRDPVDDRDPFGEPPVWEGRPIAIRRFSRPAEAPISPTARGSRAPVRGPRPVTRPPLFERLRSLRPIERP